MAILIANDDGIYAPGLAALVDALVGLDDLHVSAPASNQSGVGMGISIGRDLTASRHPDGPGKTPRYSITGTPADAVKYGLQQLLPDTPPRLVVSGINLGPNLGRNVRCSGTVGAACEAATSGIPSLAVSVDYVLPPVWDGAKHYARMVAEMALRMIDAGTYGTFMLNLNVPAKQHTEILGLAAARHGMGGFLDILRRNPDADSYFLDGEWAETTPDAECDSAAFNAGFAVVTPMQFDMTDHTMLSRLKSEWQDELTDLSPTRRSTRLWPRKDAKKAGLEED